MTEASKPNSNPKTAAKSKAGASRTGLAIVAGFSILAALAGGAMGAVAAWHWDKARTPNDTRISALESRISSEFTTQNAKIQALETELTQERRKNAALQSRVTQLEDEIADVRTTPPKSLEPMGVAVVEVGGAIPDPSNTPGAVQMSEREAEADASGALPDKVGLPEIEIDTELQAETEQPERKFGEVIGNVQSSSLETPLATNIVPEDDSRMIRLALISDFPKADLLSAIPAEKSEAGWRALWKKHAQSGDSPATRDHAAIFEAEAALAREDISGAVSALGKTSPEVQEAAMDWLSRANNFIQD